MSSPDVDLDTRIREYARQVVAARGPMTPDERAQVVAILRGVQGVGQHVATG